jgi:hypothetical protein
MQLTSPAFSNEGIIPDRFTCKDLNINPALEISDIPEGTKSLAIIMDDPDSPSGHFVHWVGYDIEPTDFIAEGSRPGRQGPNDGGGIGYTGPCPSKGTHRYVIRLFALDTKLHLPDGKSRAEIEQAIEGHVLAEAELRGSFTLQGA